MENSNVNPAQAPAKSDNSKVFAVLSYIGILWIIGLVASPEKDNPYVKNHVNNGIILTIAGVASSVISTIIKLVLSFISEAAGVGLSQAFAGLIWVVVITLAIFGLVAAAGNKYYKIPFIGDSLKIVK